MADDWKFIGGLFALVVLGGIIIIAVANITRPRSYQVKTLITRDPNSQAILDTLETVTYL